MTKSNEDLHEQWLEALTPFAVAQPLAEKTFKYLVTAYCDSGRFYHNLCHIEKVLATIVRLTEHAPSPTLQLAAWFHDVVYDTRAKDNEEQSASLAGAMLKEMNVPGPVVEATKHLILLTKNHVADAEDEEGKILLDADLAILAESADRYAAYATAIRQEYAWVPEADYRSGRSKVLADFLKRPRIYHTHTMFAACEQPARDNLAAEIERLTST